MDRLEAALDRANSISLEKIAENVQSIGFECTRCGECCRGTPDDPHVATVFPTEIRKISEATGRSWSEIVRPMPYGLSNGTGETFEWALQTDADNSCVFLEDDGQETRCRTYQARPHICRTYPFRLALPGTGTPESTAVATSGVVEASACPGLGASTSRKRALAIASTLKERAKLELRETIALRDAYQPVSRPDSVVVHDSEGAKRPDGTTFEASQGNNYY